MSEGLGGSVDVIERFLTALENEGYVIRHKDEDRLSTLLTITHPDVDGELKLDVWTA